jgi:hypothetical protein
VEKENGCGFFWGMEERLGVNREKVLFFSFFFILKNIIIIIFSSSSEERQGKEGGRKSLGE